MNGDFERWYNSEPMFDGIQDGALIYRVAWKAWQAASARPNTTPDIDGALNALRRDLESLRNEHRGVVSCTINYRSVG